MSIKANKARILRGVRTHDSSLGEEVVSDVKAFIENEETDLIQDAKNAYIWLQGELTTMEPVVLSDLKAAVAAAFNEAVSGTSSGGSIVADTLTVLARDGADILAKVDSDVVTALVGLVTTKPAAPVASEQPVG